MLINLFIIEHSLSIVKLILFYFNGWKMKDKHTRNAFEIELFGVLLIPENWRCKKGMSQAFG